MIGRVRVAGHSMEPSLHDGETVIYVSLPPRPGSVVVARDPRDEISERLVVKRIAGIDRDEVTLRSDRTGHESLVVHRRSILGLVPFR